LWLGPSFHTGHQGVGRCLFIIAFYGIFSPADLGKLSFLNGRSKYLRDPGNALTYLVVGWLKRHEEVDFYDRDTNFNPVKF
jgi:hypothetical protein